MFFFISSSVVLLYLQVVAALFLPDFFISSSQVVPRLQRQINMWYDPLSHSQVMQTISVSGEVVFTVGKEALNNSACVTDQHLPHLQVVIKLNVL